MTVFEVHFGLELLAEGRRRRRLEDAFARALDEDFEARVLPFEESAARAAPLIAARRRQGGRAIEIRDAQIAGIASARRATLATRNPAFLRPWDPSRRSVGRDLIGLSNVEPRTML